jgi:glutamyl-tRNA reductase
MIILPTFLVVILGAFLFIACVTLLAIKKEIAEIAYQFRTREIKPQTIQVQAPSVYIQTEELAKAIKQGMNGISYSILRAPLQESISKELHVYNEQLEASIRDDAILFEKTFKEACREQFPSDKTFEGPQKQ